MYMLFKKTYMAKPRGFLPGSFILSFIPHREFFLIFAVNRRLLAVRFVTPKSVCSQIYLASGLKAISIGVFTLNV